MEQCNLCPRKCNVIRQGVFLGYCNSPKEIMASKAYLHMWEEPCISGKNGSGTVFFNGCNLRCIFCQNHAVSQKNSGKILTLEELAGIFMNLQTKGAHNINLVTPTHYAFEIKKAVDIAKDMGLEIPVVYNSGGYELVDTLKEIEDIVDIYLPDFKYMDGGLAQKYSGAGDYPEVTKAALAEMVRQKDKVIIDNDGIARKGVIVRHMLLPGSLKNSKAVVEYLYKTYGDSIFISIMNQYTPIGEFPEHPELSETPSRREYEKLVDYALSLGVKNAYVQDSASSDKAFIPDFDMEGI